MVSELRLVYPSLPALEADHRDNLRKGRAFVPCAPDLPERAPCQLVIVHPATGATLSLGAEVVWVKRDAPGAGVGVQLVDAGEALRDQLRQFVEAAPAEVPSPEETDDSPPEEPDDLGPRGAPLPRNVHERVRGLSIRERETLARQGSLTERIALERAFGSSVWEGLLQNPQLTPPEVARVAKNGSLPRPLVVTIVSNAAWLAVPEVQRALLSNPRVSGPQLDKVLRTMPRGDLERVAGLTAYRSEVRQSAAKLLGRGR